MQTRQTKDSFLDPVTTGAFEKGAPDASLSHVTTSNILVSYPTPHPLVPGGNPAMD